MQWRLPTNTISGTSVAPAASMSVGNSDGANGSAHSCPARRSAWVRVASCFQQGEKVVGVFQGRPTGAQGLDINLGVWLGHYWRWHRFQLQRSALYVCAETFDQRRPGGFVAVFGEKDFMHGHALMVEYLNAALRAFAGFFGHGEHAGPAAKEQAQVDVRETTRPICPFAITVTSR